MMACVSSKTSIYDLYVNKAGKARMIDPCQ